jgi:hypothetical protein
MPWHGPISLLGPVGPSGQDGEDGQDSLVPGPMGFQGLPGPTGMPGLDGADGEDSYIPGQPGLSGISGLTTGTLPKATSATSLSDSIVSEGTGTITISGGLQVNAGSKNCQQVTTGFWDVQVAGTDSFFINSNGDILLTAKANRTITLNTLGTSGAVDITTNTFLVVVTTSAQFTCPSYFDVQVNGTDNLFIHSSLGMTFTANPGKNIAFLATVSGSTMPITVYGSSVWSITNGTLTLNGGTGLVLQTNAVTRLSLHTSGALSLSIDTMTYASTISLDVTKPNIHKTTTTAAVGDCTINASAGGTGIIDIIIVNDATAGRTITFGTNFLSTGTLVGTISKTATIRFVGDGTTWYETSRTLGL